MLRNTNSTPIIPRGLVTQKTKHAVGKYKTRHRLTETLNGDSITAPVFPVTDRASDKDLVMSGPLVEFMDGSVYLKDTSVPQVEMSLNGMLVNKGPTHVSNAKLRHILYKNLRFIGWAQSDSVYDPTAPQLTPSTVSQIHGSRTVQNTGLNTVCTADLVCWRIPDVGRTRDQIPNDNSVPRSKNARVIETCPLQFDDAPLGCPIQVIEQLLDVKRLYLLNVAMAQSATDKLGMVATDTNPPVVHTALHNVLNSVASSVMAQKLSKIIGVAQETAPANEHFVLVTTPFSQQRATDVFAYANPILSKEKELEFKFLGSNAILERDATRTHYNLGVLNKAGDFGITSHTDPELAMAAYRREAKA